MMCYITHSVCSCAPWEMVCISLKEGDILQEICGINQKQDVFLVLALPTLPPSLSLPKWKKKLKIGAHSLSPNHSRWLEMLFSWQHIPRTGEVLWIWFLGLLIVWRLFVRLFLFVGKFISILCNSLPLKPKQHKKRGFKNTRSRCYISRYLRFHCNRT